VAPSYWPVGLAVRDRAVVIVGGDGEALAKARRLLLYGAHVTVVAPNVMPEMVGLTPWISWVPRRYRPGDVAGAAAAIVTDPTEVEAVREEAWRLGVPVNVQDQPGYSDFIAMATCRRGPVEIAVHTNGASAALSQALRDWINMQIPDAVGALAEVLGALRPIVRRRIVSPEERRRFWHSAVAEGLSAIERGRFESAAFRDHVVRCLQDATARGGDADSAGTTGHQPA
jgi:siroheme synthase-like protein